MRESKGSSFQAIAVTISTGSSPSHP